MPSDTQALFGILADTSSAKVSKSFRYDIVSWRLICFHCSGSIAKKANHLGVKPSSLKLPLITSISYSTARSKDWDDVVTASQGESLGRAWSVERKRVGKHVMQAGGPVKATAMSACGNFGFVGTGLGEVVMYNMQSGLKRKNFRVPHGGVGDVRGKHVTGVAVDALNRVVVVSTLKGGLHVSAAPDEV